MIDRVRDAFFALDTDFRFTYLNEEAEALLERSREHLIGRVMWDEFPETVETQFPDGFYRAMDEQVAVAFEVYHTPLETWFEVRAWPAEGGLSVHMRDVTDRKARETKLARNSAVVEAIQDGVVTLDDDNRILSINTTLGEALDVDAEAVRGDHVEALLAAGSVSPEDTLRVGRALSDVDVGNTSFRTLELPYTDASGVERVADIRVVPIDHESANIAAVARDITDQREYERVITSLHEVTRWLVQSNDPSEICAIAVHAGSDLLGLPISGIWLLDDEHGYLEPIAGTAGAHDEFGGLPRFRPGEGLVWDVFESGEIEHFENVHTHEGVYNPETPIRSEIIAPVGTHGVLITGSKRVDDFTETDMDLVSTLVENTGAALDRAIREQALEERTDQLERKTDHLEAVAAVLSRDLKGQLQTVAAALEDEQAGGSGPAVGSDEEETDAATGAWEFPLAEDTVRTTLDRAERLVDDVREFARTAISVGSRTRLDLEAAIEAAITASSLERPAVVVEADATLRADPDRFQTLLQTVFDDAARRSDSAVTIQIGLLGLEKPGADTRGFFLMDDADEIPPTKRDRVTEIRPERGADGRPDSGLGLPLARAIAEAHDWTLEVTGGQHGGTRIEIRDVTTLERH